ncbi:MAG: ATP-binding protein [Acholeplasmataceae bacterium]
MNTLEKIIKNDPEVKDLKIDPKDYHVVYQYISIRDSNLDPNYTPKLNLSPYVHITYVPTKEKIIKDQTRLIKDNLETFESDIYISDASLNDFILVDNNHEKALNYSKRFINDPKNYHKGMYIHGPYGTGKSFFLSGLANELTKLGVRVVFVFIPDFVRSIKGAISTGELEKKINILKKCDYLILDDLGGEYYSAWFRDEILLPIIHYRLNADLPIFVSSNYSLKELAETLIKDSKGEGATQVLRLMQRITDMTKNFRFNKTLDDLDK